MIAIILSPIYLALNAYILVRLLRYLSAVHERLKHPVIWTITMVVYIFFMLTPLTGFLIKKEPWHHALKSMSNYWLGVLAVGLITLIFFDIGRFILNKTKWKDDHPNEKRFKICGTCAILIVVILSTYGFLHSKHIVVNHQTVMVEKELNRNLKIALVADTHLGYSIGEYHMKQMVEKINEQNPDIVIFAGDIFDNEYGAIKNPEKVAKTLAGLKSKYGSYACWGNHDINELLLAGFTIKNDEYSDDANFREFLKKSKINLLEDKSTLIDNSFYLVGRKDPFMSKKLGENRKDIRILTKTLDKTKPIFVIDHEPLELKKIARAGVDLDLSGHTHNGQIFPGNIIMKFIWDNPNGIKKVESMTSIVTSGAGIWGPAMRIGSNSEIMIIDVKSK